MSCILCDKSFKNCCLHEFSNWTYICKRGGAKTLRLTYICDGARVLFEKYVDGWLNMQKFYIGKDKLHIKIYEDGEIVREEKRKDGKIHADNEPAVIGRNGNELYLEYRQDGKYHRLDGPAVETICDGEVKSRAYYIGGRKVPESTFGSRHAFFIFETGAEKY